MNYYFAKSIFLIIAATAATAVSADTSGAAKSIESFNDVLDDDYAHDPVSASIDDEDRYDHDSTSIVNDEDGD